MKDRAEENPKPTQMQCAARDTVASRKRVVKAMYQPVKLIFSKDMHSELAGMGQKLYKKTIY